MKKLLVTALIVAAGLGLGGGAAYATATILGPRPVAPPSADSAFVPTGKILAPLVRPDGGLAGYVTFEVVLEVPADTGPDIEARLPLLLHAINMRTFKTPLAAGPDGLLPEIGLFRSVVTKAAAEAFGKDAVRRVAVTQATPA